MWEPAVMVEIRRRNEPGHQWISHDILEMMRRHYTACLDLLWVHKISWRRIVANNLDDPRISEEERKELWQRNRR